MQSSTKRPHAMRIASRSRRLSESIGSMRKGMADDLAPAAGPRWVELEGGTFVMGSDDFYDDEAPARPAHVDPFAIGLTPVTNRQFAAFVDAIGYVTVAERAHGSLVFTPTAGPVDLRDWRQWWILVHEANWRHPRGKGHGPRAEDLPDHPVVQVTHADARAYAEWVGGRLPTETELEYASGGGKHPAPYAWGSTRDLNGHIMANTWRGSFPYFNRGANGWIGTSPVGTFSPNGFGLFDCIGNVWEWTSTPYRATPTASSCACSPASDAGCTPTAERLVLKGGSHLCAPEYCLRYRPAARSSQDGDSTTTHIGFRVAKNATTTGHP